MKSGEKYAITTYLRRNAEDDEDEDEDDDPSDRRDPSQ